LVNIGVTESVKSKDGGPFLGEVIRLPFESVGLRESRHGPYLDGQSPFAIQIEAGASC
jgi:hypothetical protein